MTNPFGAVLLVLSAPACAQSAWQTEQIVAEVVRPVAPLRLKLERDEAKLGNKAGSVVFLDGRLVRTRRYSAARSKDAAAWRYAVNYNSVELIHDDAYLTRAEAKGFIRPDRDLRARGEMAVRLLPEVESAASRLAFLDSAKAQIRERFKERFEDRKMQADYADDKALEEMKLVAGLDRLFYEWDKALVDCRRLKRFIGVAPLLDCPAGAVTSPATAR